MKKILINKKTLILAVTALFVLFATVTTFSPSSDVGAAVSNDCGIADSAFPLNDTVTLVIPRRYDSIDAMAEAFAIQESRKTESAVSPCGKYVGALQIGKSMVAEANRLCGVDMFWANDEWDDRKDWQGSLAIFTVIMDYRNPTLDIDKAVDIWNPNCPIIYRDNVKYYYDSILKTL